MRRCSYELTERMKNSYFVFLVNSYITRSTSQKMRDVYLRVFAMTSQHGQRTSCIVCFFHIANTNERHFPLSCITKLWHEKKKVPPHVCSLCWYSIPLTRVVQFDLFSHSFVTLSTLHVSKLCCQVHFYFRRLASLSGIAIPSYLYQHITNSDEGMGGRGG